ncbi:MAG: hypothetical protein ACREAM_11405 [Blastocatellia bacterium]
MSQENSTSGKSQETRKKLFLGGLLAVFAGVIYFQFFSGSDAPSPAPRAASANVTTTPTPPPRPTSPRAGGTPEPIVSQPLDLASIRGRDNSSSGIGRNIFVYPTPTPAPPPPPQPTVPPPPPPPISLFSINPAGVTARTGEFTLTLFGEKIPQDAQGFFDGRAYPTTFVSGAEIKIKIPAEAIRAPGNISVMIRSQSDAKLYSGSASLNVAAPPDPPYKYIGLIVTKNGPTAVLKSTGDDDVHNVKKGERLGGHWKIINITPQKIEIEDTNIRISHIINYSGETG